MNEDDKKDQADQSGWLPSGEPPPGAGGRTRKVTLRDHIVQRDNDAHEFYLKVGRSLGACQLVEQQLKLYLAEAYLLVRKQTNDVIPFKFESQDNEDAPLGVLVKAFSRLNDNGELIQSLKAFVKERNFLSHRAVTSCYYPDGSVSTQDMSDLEPRLKDIEAKAEELTEAIHMETNRVMIHLHFEDLDEP
jgi:hypothetical protein